MSRPNRGLICAKHNCPIGQHVFDIGDEIDPIEMDINHYRLTRLLSSRYVIYGEIVRPFEDVVEANEIAREEAAKLKEQADKSETAEVYVCPHDFEFGTDFNETDKECSECELKELCKEALENEQDENKDEEEEEEEEAQTETTQAGSEAKDDDKKPKAVIQARSHGWFDVLVDGKPINEDALRRDDAIKLAKEHNNG